MYSYYVSCTLPLTLLTSPRLRVTGLSLLLTWVVTCRAGRVVFLYFYVHGGIELVSVDRSSLRISSLYCSCQC